MEAVAFPTERKKVGRKKKAVPSDYVAVKIPRDVYVNAKLISTFTGEEMAQIMGNILRAPLEKRAEEVFKASRSDKPKR